MNTQTVQMSGHPTKADADRTVRIWKLEPNYVPNSGRSFQEGATWTAEAKFFVAATSSAATTTAAPKPALPVAASLSFGAARAAASLASIAVAPSRPKIDPALQNPLAAQGFARVIAVLAPGGSAALSASTARHLLMTPETVAEARLELAGLSAKSKPSPSHAASIKRAATQSAVRVFPRLGVALGYVDPAGLRAAAADPGLQAVYSAPPISLIRPVSTAAAKATGQVTWGLSRIEVPRVWKEIIDGKGVAVAHLDTGLDGKHSAIKPALARGKFAFFDLAGNLIPGAPAIDSDTHGTHTAGTLCGGKVKKLSIGVAPGASLYSATVIEGGDVLMRILAGMEWALDQHARVLSMSLGIRGYTPFFRDVTKALRRNNCLPVVAIGNDFAGTTRSPGNYPEVLSVGACDRHDQVPPFSSSGSFQNPPHTEPNVVAPGVDVISSVPGGKLATNDGTSMATPHVAGVAALLMQAHPQATIDQIENAIMSTARPLPGITPARQGFGLINAWAALQAL